MKEIFQEIALLGLWGAQSYDELSSFGFQVNVEVKNILLPIPFSVKTLTQPDLFAGKLHAILCRPWEKKKVFSTNDLFSLLADKISQTDFKNAKSDILPFISDKAAISTWSQFFFTEISRNIRTTS